MAALTGRRQFGLYTNGQAQYGDNTNFGFYSYTNEDSLSGDGCFLMNNVNARGSSVVASEYVPVDPANNSYVASVSVKTKTTNYLGNNGSGHLGFACYDINKSFIGHNQAFSTSNTTLSRVATSGDTKIYITNADASMISNMNSATSHVRSLNFYFAGSPYPTVGGYTRYNMYTNVVQNSITQTGSGDWEITFTTGLPNWGYSYSVGTPIGRAFSGGSYNYAFGAPIYPATWTTYTTPVMTGYVIGGASSGANFRDGTKYIRFLNLVNYNYRTQSGGDAATYYLDNVMFYRVKPPTPVHIAQGKSYNAEFDDAAKREKIGKIDRFKRTRRGGQKKEDFF